MKVELSTEEIKDIVELMELGYDGICDDEDEKILQKYEKLIYKLGGLV